MVRKVYFIAVLNSEADLQKIQESYLDVKANLVMKEFVVNR